MFLRCISSRCVLRECFFLRFLAGHRRSLPVGWLVVQLCSAQLRAFPFIPGCFLTAAFAFDSWFLVGIVPLVPKEVAQQETNWHSVSVHLSPSLVLGHTQTHSEEQEKQHDMAQGFHVDSLIAVRFPGVESQLKANLRSRNGGMVKTEKENLRHKRQNTVTVS